LNWKSLSILIDIQKDLLYLFHLIF
jgi:hypothetical protein